MVHTKLNVFLFSILLSVCFSVILPVNWQVFTYSYAAEVIDDYNPQRVTDLVVKDTPGDEGGSITLTWILSKDEENQQNTVTGYEIYQALAIGGPYEIVGTVTPGTSTFVSTGLENGKGYFYRVRTVSRKGFSDTRVGESIVPRANWFNSKESWVVIIGIWILFWIIYYIRAAAAGKELYIRKIAGIEAVEDAVGRATEMGRSVLFIPGIQDMDNVQTVAGLTILASIAKKTAEYETKLNVHVSRSIVMSTGRETVKEAYLSQGRPDLFYEDMVYYITDEQFGYVAAVDGIMVREKPAACFYMGAFFAESLILAETGNYVGAIQIAGTAMPSQLPFFVAACDYTLIGEELFAASAYLSGDKKIIGALKGQDVGKVTAMGAIFLGTIFATLYSLTGNETFKSMYDFVVNIFSIS